MSEQHVGPEATMAVVRALAAKLTGWMREPDEQAEPARGESEATTTTELDRGGRSVPLARLRSPGCAVGSGGHGALAPWAAGRPILPDAWPAVSLFAARRLCRVHRVAGA